jgi:DNA-binding NtrC family response regulator
MTNETILILDNEPHIRWTLKNLLESEGYLTITADSVEGALNCLSEHRISGLITEYCIGKFPTLEPIRDLKRRFPEVYVMMLTIHEMNEERYEETINAGVDDLFGKPCSGKKILVHLKKGLRLNGSPKNSPTGTNPAQLMRREGSALVETT